MSAIKILTMSGEFRFFGDVGPQGPRGPIGETGNGIQEIVKTDTQGLIDTYTITYTNGNTITYTVTNGRDGQDGDIGPQGPQGDDYVITQADYQEIADVVENDIQPILEDIENTSQIANSNSLEALGNSQTAISTANTAEAIARGKSEARAFDTLTTMINWISNVANKGVLKTGDNLYIIQTDIPDYWVVEPLQTPNAEGYYYTIAMLETEKPDLSNMVTTNTIQVITGDKNFTGALKKNNVNVVADDNYTHTDNNYTTQEKNKLAGLENYNDTEVRADITDLQTNKANTSDIPTKTSDLTNNSGFIDNTDYATTSRAGVIFSPGSAYGISVSGGIITPVKANEVDIDAKTNNYKAIVPNNLDYAVRSVRPLNATVLPATCIVNTIYTLGVQASVSIVLPATAQVGDNIEVQFVSGNSATTLSISSSAGLLNSDIIPETNTQYSIIASWESIGADTYGWKIYSSEAEV